MANNNIMPPPPPGYQVQGGSAPPDQSMMPPPPSGYQVQPSPFEGQSLTAPGPNDIVANNPNLIVKDDYTKLPKSYATIAANLPTDPMAKIQFLAKSLFPGMNFNDSMARFGQLGGRLYYVDNDGQAYYAEPKFAPVTDPKTTLKDLPDTLAKNLGPSLPMIGSIGGGAVTDWMGGVPGAAAGGAAGDVLRQTLANIFTGEQKPFLQRAYQTGTQAAAGGAGQVFGNALNAGAKALFDRNPLGVAGFDTPDVTPQSINEAQLLSDTAQRSGVDLTPGEATGLPSLITRQRQLGRNPASMNTLSNFYENRNVNQIPQAYQDMLNNISGQGSSALGSRNMAEGAQASIDAAIAARKEAADPLYKAAYDANQSVSSPELDAILRAPAGRDALKATATAMQNGRTLLGVSDPEMTAAKNEAVKLNLMADPQTGAGVASGLKLKTYDLIKQQLYDAEQAAKDDFGRPTFQSKQISSLRVALTKELDKLDVTAVAGPNSVRPEGGSYQQARKLFQEGSPAVTELDKGIVGLAAKDRATNFQQVPNTIFGPTSDSLSITTAKNAYAKAGQADAWNEGLRSYLQNIYDGASKQTQGPASTTWKTLMADPRQAANMRAAMTPEQYSAFKDMMDIFEAVKRAPPEGSPTATDLGAGADLRSPVATGVSNMLKGVKFWDIPSQLAGVIDRSSSAKGARSMANVITSPGAIETLQRLKMLKPGTQKFITEIGNLGAYMAYGSLKPNGPDTLPPYLQSLPQNMQPTVQ